MIAPLALDHFVPDWRLRPGALCRGLIAGTAWGLVTGVGIVAINAAGCGVLCVEDAAIALGASIAAGCVTIGPLAAFAPVR